MKKKFSHITLSIFHNCELHIFAQNLQNNAEYKEEFRKGIISLKQDTLNISQYFDSTLGARFEKFTFWSIATILIRFSLCLICQMDTIILPDVLVEN